MPLRDLPVGRLGQSVARILASRVKASPLDNTTIAAKSRISLSQLRRITTGERPVNVDQLDLLTAALGTTPVEVLTEAEADSEDRPRDENTYPSADEILKKGDY